MNKFQVTVTVTATTLDEAVNIYRIVQEELWNRSVEPEQIEASCTLNGEDFFTIGNNGQKLTIDDLAFGLGD